ncbi:MAG TPA: DUF4136 domain-containing protein [Myxococcaceae bacterium]|nr:DUF4136 domain-containing protein [Myxococcaceae bacterium]
MPRFGKDLAPPILALGLLLAACHPTGVETISDLDVVATTRDPNFNFATPTTYKLPVTIPLIGSDQDPAVRPPDVLPADLTQLILSTIDTEMTAQGYVKAGPSATPDLVVTAAALKVTNISYYYQYWCGYWGYYYNPCYPYYPPVAVSSYVVGSLIIDLTPFPPDTSGSRTPGVWTALIRGIQSGVPSTDRARIVNGISQAFSQSSDYLGK